MAVDAWGYYSRTLKWAILLHLVAFTLVIIAFSTSYWLESVPDDTLEEPKFTNLGLWEVCLNGYHDQFHQYEVKFYGCKHILLEEYNIIRHELQPGFMVASQVLYTMSFCGMLLSLLANAIYILCMNDYYRVNVLRFLAVDLVVSGTLAALAVIVFGANADGRAYMPEWEHNYLSWSYGLAALGVVIQWIDGVLFWIESRILHRQETAQDKQQFAMERNV